MPDVASLIASGDLRLSANRTCLPAQEKVEEAVIRAIEVQGCARGAASANEALAAKAAAVMEIGIEAFACGTNDGFTDGTAP